MPQNTVVISKDRVRVPLLLRYLITGQYILSRGDNASFWHDATEDYRDKPVVKLTRARWRRVLRRNLAITVPLLLLVLAVTPWVALWFVALYLGALLLAVSAWCSVAGVRAMRGRAANRKYVDPAAATLHAELGARYVKRKARPNVQIPRGWRAGETEEPVRLIMPVARALTDAQKKKLVKAVGGRLGILNAVGRWFDAGPAVTVDISGTPMPPAEVTYEDLRAAVEAAPVTRPIAGMGPHGPLAIDYEQDSPHVACSGPPGTGKSTLFRFLAAQRIRHGNGAIFLDYKRWSHAWAHELDAERCQYWYQAEHIHNALVSVGEELDRRINGTRDQLGTYRTVDLYVEEINSLIKLLTFYWKGQRKTIMEDAKIARDAELDYDSADLDPPTLSPAVAALQYAVFMGREMQIHVHVMAQKLEANVFGSNSGGAVRDSFQIRFMAKWDRKLFKMLADGHEYVAWPGGKRGLWGVVLDGEFHIFRVPNLSEAEAIALATSGQPVHGPILGQGFGHEVLDMDTDVATPALASGQPLAKILGQLPGQDGPDALSIEGLRTAAKRPGFPLAIGQDGLAKLYDVGQVQQWRERVLAKRLGQ